MATAALRTGAASLSAALSGRGKTGGKERPSCTRGASEKLRSSFHGAGLEAKSGIQDMEGGNKRLGVARSALATSPVKLSKVEKWQASKRLQTQVQQIAPDTTCIRSLDWDRDRFDIEFGLQNGTTYNSFVIQGEKTAVIDVSHEKFRDLYVAALQGEVDPSTIDYVLVNHTEPDHSGLVPDVLALAPDATVVGSRVAIQFLQNLVLKPFKSQIVKAGDTLDLGKGHVLEFVMAPNLHWPDTMFTLDRGTGTMFTCDAFGMHFCSETVFDDDLSTLEPHFRFYYDCLMRPNSRSVLGALKKIGDWEYSTIATGHGPLLRNNVPELMGKYESWSKSALEKQSASVAVLYVSDYGFCDRLSQAIARGITKTGAGVEMVDLNTVETQELVEVVGRNAAVVVMSPPQSGPASTAASTLLSALTSKQPVVVAESYGGNDEPVDTLLGRFTNLGLTSPIPALRVKEEPSEATYQEFEEAGTDLGQLLTKKKTIEEKKSSMPVSVSKALARVSGGLYVVTAAKGSSRGAMVASWVSQASFKPLGITISVAKDRAIESLMQVGDVFALNCLEEGNYAPLMKHFLKRYPPGADRFEGVSWAPASNGCPILTDSLAYMECKVVSRMETADHWISYAEVTDGNVSKADGKTAAHHRKIGDYY